MIKDGHDAVWAGHPGQKCTMALLESSYYWLHMKDDIEVYVRACLVDEVEEKVPGGLLEPLPVEERPCDNITMDFITCLPNSEGFVTIMVVVDRFLKYIIFTATTANFKAEEATHLFLRDVVKYWGVPKNIISNRDFTSTFWRELFNLFESELHFSTSFHPLSDGQMHFWSCTKDISLVPIRRIGRSCLTQLSSLTIFNILNQPGGVPSSLQLAATQHVTILAYECIIKEFGPLSYGKGIGRAS